MGVYLQRRVLTSAGAESYCWPSWAVSCPIRCLWSRLCLHRAPPGSGYVLMHPIGNAHLLSRWCYHTSCKVKTETISHRLFLYCSIMPFKRRTVSSKQRWTARENATFWAPRSFLPQYAQTCPAKWSLPAHVPLHYQCFPVYLLFLLVLNLQPSWLSGQYNVTLHGSSSNYMAGTSVCGAHQSLVCNVKIEVCSTPNSWCVNSDEERPQPRPCLLTRFTHPRG